MPVAGEAICLRQWESILFFGWKIFPYPSFSPRVNFRWRESALIVGIWFKNVFHWSHPEVSYLYLIGQAWAKFWETVFKEQKYRGTTSGVEGGGSAFPPLALSPWEVGPLDHELELTSVCQLPGGCLPFHLQQIHGGCHPELCFLRVQAALLLRGSWGGGEARGGEGRKKKSHHVIQQVKPKNFIGKSYGRGNSCRAVWRKSPE